MTTMVVPVVREEKGEITADSRDVAEYFNKEHKSVLRGIRNLLKDMPNLAVQFCAMKYKARGREFDCYRMSKNGFLMLAMGFTGSDANRLRWAYIQEFNRMQEALKTIWDHRHQSLMEAANELSRIEGRLYEAASRGGKDMSRWRLAKPKIESSWIELREQGQLMLELKPGKTLKPSTTSKDVISFVAPVKQLN